MRTGRPHANFENIKDRYGLVRQAAIFYSKLRKRAALIEVYQFNFKIENGIARNRPITLATICKRGRNDDIYFTRHFNQGNGNLPAWNQGSELPSGSAVIHLGIKHGSIEEGALILDINCRVQIGSKVNGIADRVGGCERRDVAESRLKKLLRNSSFIVHHCSSSAAQSVFPTD